MKKLKILLLFKNIDGGTGTYLKTLAKIPAVFKKRPLSLSILVIDKPLYRSSINFKYKYHSRLKSPLKRYHFASSIKIYKELLWFRREINNFDPDIVISEDLHSIFISECAKMFFNFRYRSFSFIYNNIQKVIENKIPKYMQWGVIRMFSFLLNRSNLVATISVGLSENIHNYFKLKRLPNIIFTGILNRLSSQNRRKINLVVSIGRFDSQKDFTTLIYAFKKVIKRIPSAKLLLIGDGPLKEDLLTLSRKLNVLQHISFTGWVQQPVLKLSLADVFVLPSKWEGFGLVILEAMSQGVPVIASNCDFGPSEILMNGKYGLLVPVGDVNYLANSMITVLSNRQMNHYYHLMSLKRAKDYPENRALKQYQKLILDHHH